MRRKKRYRENDSEIYLAMMTRNIKLKIYTRYCSLPKITLLTSRGWFNYFAAIILKNPRKANHQISK